jgi:hypothetical protein
LLEYRKRGNKPLTAPDFPLLAWERMATVLRTQIA